jgi:hypothetical protein
MRRTYKRESFTDEELENLKLGRCWCGKERQDFMKGMRVYCTPEHREIWASKTLTWQEFRNRFMNKHGKFCDSCGRKSSEDLYWEQTAVQKKYINEHIPQIKPQIIAERLLRLEDRYNRDFLQAISDDIDIYEAERYLKSKNIKLPTVSNSRIDVAFEVDHKIAIVNGGPEFDENNLQVLCSDCHKKKTKTDLKLTDNVQINMDNTQSQGTLELEESGK